LLHGRLDQVVSFETSEKIINKIESENKQLKIIEDGDHSLSRDQDLKILFQTITELAL
jgi:esterase/lipase